MLLIILFAFLQWGAINRKYICLLKGFTINMRILVFEPNNHHYEILPGFCKLFERLGFEVDLLVRNHSGLGDEFCRANISVNVFQYDKDGYEALKKRVIDKEYCFVFISSLDHIEDGKLIDIVKRLDDIHLKTPFFGCFHDLSNIDKFENVNLLKDRRIVTLSDYMYKDTLIPMVNPQYFSEHLEKHKKNETTSFVMVGTNIWRNELEHSLDSECLKRINFNIESIGAFDEKKYNKNRLKRTVFFPVARILHISKYSNPSMKPASKQAIQHITNVGKLPFPEMYHTIEKSDFILLNIKVKPNTDFITRKTSGSKQLALGFNKPPIMPEEIADAYGFDSTNAVLYTEGHLDDALIRACRINDQEYQQMKKNIENM